VTVTPTRPMQVEYDRYSMKINGQPTVIRSAAMHYFRLPGQNMWRDRLYKLKAAGYNTVDLYFCWSFHSPEQGVYDFTGVRDVKKLLEIAAELGFFLIARPGPYINAEYTGGGIPGWLLAKQDVVLRNRDADGNHVWSEPYMQAVTEWWDQIIPFIREYPYLLMVQIENEYATSDMEPDYMQALYKMTRDRGITVPLMHNDMYASGLFEEVVDIYAFDNYSVTSFEADWRESDGVFGILDHVEENMRPYCQNRPLMVAELQAGWFGGWKGYPYQHIIDHLGREHIGVVTKTLLAQGLTIFSHYKGVGGTNWGYMGSTDVYTSYDFGAPISESGVNTERLFEAKALNLFLDSFDLAQTDRVNFEDASEDDAAPFTWTNASDEASLLAVRQNKELGGYWLFARNLSAEKEQASWDYLSHTVQVSLAAHSVKILPMDQPLLSGDTLVFSSSELLYQTQSLLVLKGESDNTLLFDSASDGAVSRVSEGVQHEMLSNGWVKVTTALKNDEGFAHFRVGELTVFVLGQYWSDRAWKEVDGSLVLGPEARFDSGEYGMSVPSKTLLCLSPNGQLTQERQLGVMAPDETDSNAPLNEEDVQIDRPFASPLALTGWECHHEAPQLYSSQGFAPVSKAGPDLDSNGYYEGSAWYRYEFDGSALQETTGQSITVFARHIWAVFLNGQYIGQGHHWFSVKDPTQVAPEKIMLPPSLLNTEGPNELCLFVDSLGHPKGFHDDGQEPQGLITLKLGQEDISNQVNIFPGIRGWTHSFREAFGLVPEASPIVRVETRFKLPDLSGWSCPLGLVLEEMPCERVNIHLNGILIGRYWKACDRQNRFYLPDDLLNLDPEAENQLALVLINFDPLISTAAPLPDTCKLSIAPYQTLLRYTR
jgi:hypothetical protein